MAVAADDFICRWPYSRKCAWNRVLAQYKDHFDAVVVHRYAPNACGMSYKAKQQEIILTGPKEMQKERAHRILRKPRSHI